MISPKCVRREIERFRGDTSGEVDMTASDRAVSVIVSIVVAALLAAFLLPIAINELTGVDTTGWGSGAAELWSLLSVMIVLSIFLFFVQVAIDSR